MVFIVQDKNEKLLSVCNHQENAEWVAENLGGMFEDAGYVRPFAVSEVRPVDEPGQFALSPPDIVERIADKIRREA